MAQRKNPAAVKLGRLGGAARARKLSVEELSAIGRKAGEIGGKARAAALTDKRRSEIARKAAVARWKDKPTQEQAAGGAGVRAKKTVQKPESGV